MRRREARGLSTAVKRYLHDAGTHHTERTRCTDGQVDHAPSHERTAIVHAAANGVAAIFDGDHASHGTRPVCTGHLAGMSATAVIGGQSAFGMCAREG